ncbi:hypothetical protein F511_29219 [Dorcoceras hygrometricum]|uniref:Uncharacterized protein n=1 Tax=Dorcoceras hygrometricum TaxID=472368 RepID=A0A2Z7C1L9_9LAMI|nr:hypothetical protein F511_29219 [Dorcoceras hygrometricum]
MRIRPPELETSICDAKYHVSLICVLLKNVPGLVLGESRAFPASRVLTEKTVHMYVTINEKVEMEETADAPRVKKTPAKKTVSTKRLVGDGEEAPIVKKKRTTKGKAVVISQEAVPLQSVKATTDSSTEQPPAPKRKSQKRKRRLILEGDDEIVDSALEQPATEAATYVQETEVENEQAVTAADSVTVETGFERVDEPVPESAVADVERVGEQPAVETVKEATTDDADHIIQQVLGQLDSVTTTDSGNQPAGTDGNNNNSNGKQIPNTQKRGASPGSVHIINITGTHGKGDRLAEPPLCPDWLPEDPANGQHRPKTQKQENKYELLRAAQFVPQFHKFNLTDYSKHGRTHGRCNQLSPGSKFTAAGFLELKSVQGETHGIDFSKSFEHQQLHASTPALIQGSKWVTIERAKLGESSATKIVKNRGWKRRESAVESYDAPDMHFDETDIAATLPSLPALSTDLSASFDDLQISLSVHLDESQSDILSKLHTIEKGLRDSLQQQEEAFRTLIQGARQESRTIDDVQTLRFNEFRKSVLASSVSATTDFMDVKKVVERLHTIEKGLRDSLQQQEEAFRTLIQGARQESRTIDDVQTLRFNEFRKSVLASSVSATTDFMDVKKALRELNAKVDVVSTRLDDVRKDVEATKEAISHQLLDFQAQA